MHACCTRHPSNASASTTSSWNVRTRAPDPREWLLCKNFPLFADRGLDHARLSNGKQYKCFKLELHLVLDLCCLMNTSDRSSPLGAAMFADYANVLEQRRFGLRAEKQSHLPSADSSDESSFVVASSRESWTVVPPTELDLACGHHIEQTARRACCKTSDDTFSVQRRQQDCLWLTYHMCVCVCA